MPKFEFLAHPGRTPHGRCSASLARFSVLCFLLCLWPKLETPRNLKNNSSLSLLLHCLNILSKHIDSQILGDFLCFSCSWQKSALNTGFLRELRKS